MRPCGHAAGAQEGNSMVAKDSTTQEIFRSRTAGTDAFELDLDERRRFKDRFGGDIVYFLNDAAFEECARLGLNLQFLGEISDDELPRRRTVVVGMPERTGGAPTV